MKRTLMAMAAVGLWLPAAGAGPGDPPGRLLPRLTSDDFPTGAAESVERGLAWLSAKQNDDGSWSCKIGHKLYNTYEGEEGHHVGVTALACMAFLAAGNQPGRGPYGRVVQRGTDFLLGAMREEDGYITFDGTRMYSHAFAVMYLSELYGMTPNRSLKTPLKRAVQCIVGAQNPDGGWRYSPSPVDADLSVTVSILQALRAARNAGIGVPLETIQNAQKYVRDCAALGGRSGFHYQKPGGAFGDGRGDERITFALTACGVVSMLSAGLYSAQEAHQAIDYLERRRQDFSTKPYWGRYHYFYSHYYGMQAYYQLAPRALRETYRQEIVREILDNQQPDGRWEDDVGTAYATAMACLVMQVPCEWLPIFQK